MIAKIYRLKSGRILLEIADDMLEKKIAKEVVSVSAAKKLMQYVSPEWEMLQEIKIYRTKEGKENGT